MTIIDSCIVMDLDDPTRPNHSRSVSAVAARLRVGRIYAPDIVFAEVSAGYSSAQRTRELFNTLGIEVRPLSDEALFVAAQSYKNQRAAAAQNDSIKRILPDFYVGAMAQTEGVPLLTRDIDRNWNNHFPQLKIISP